MNLKRKMQLTYILMEVFHNFPYDLIFLKKYNETFLRNILGRAKKNLSKLCAVMKKVLVINYPFKVGKATAL